MCGRCERTKWSLITHRLAFDMESLLRRRHAQKKHRRVSDPQRLSNCGLLKGHFSLPQSVHKMLSRWVRKPRPTRETEHCMQVKHSLCHWRSSKEMYLAPARPARIKRRDPCVYMMRRLIRPHLVYLTLPTRMFMRTLNTSGRTACI